MVLQLGRNNLNPSGLTNKDLDNLQQGFNHGKTLLTSANKEKSEPSVRQDDLRSVKSEYDYGAKRKFVDVLGQPKKSNNGLKGLEEFDNHPGAKNMENGSLRSRLSGKLSTTSSFKRRYEATLKK